MKTFPFTCILTWALSISLNVLMAQEVSPYSPLSSKVEETLSKDSLKILAIGNSYTIDATALLPLLVNESKVNVQNMCLYRAVRGSGSFYTWFNCWNDNDDRTYSIGKVLGGIKANVATGTGEALDGSLFRKLLSDEQWDIILLNQVSQYAPYFELWKQNNSNGCLNELLEIIHQYQPQTVIGFLIVHSYCSEDGRNTERYSALDRWKLIANSIKKLTGDYGIDFIIPYGTAVQNLRSTSYNNEYDLTRDGSHLGIGLARYTAACCFYQSLIAPRSGVSVIGNSARFDVTEADASYHSSISVNDDNASIAQLAADLAVKHPYECINPEAVLSVKSISTTDNVEFYSLEGVRLNNLQKGLNIIRTKNGTVRKVISK